MGRSKGPQRGRESRTEERRSFGGGITILSRLGGEAVPARALDLSAGGCFLFTPLSFEVGEVIVLSLELPGRPPLTLFGQIAHRRKAVHGLTGFGVQFLDLSALERAALRHTCSRLPPPVPEQALVQVFV